jgi:tRNA threonylcarbamoyladenosine biosynthesis protein TsaB
MFSLFHDQSFGQGVFSLFKDGYEVETIYRESKNSRHPCALFDLLLSRHGIDIEDISFFVCGVGPGSYTGIRSAAATIKAISLAAQKPIVAVSSLLLFAPSESGSYCIVVDGGVGGVFVQEICVSKEGCRALPPERLEREGFVVRAGSWPNLAVLSKEWIQTKILDPANLSAAGIQEISPHVCMIAKISYQEFKEGHHHSPASLPLLYLRKTQAEIEKQVSC